MYKNLAFLPASDELRQDLYKKGIDFILVKVEDTSYFMLITNQMKLIQQLTKKHQIIKFFVSDSHRQLFQVVRDFDYGFISEKIGSIKKDSTKTGKPFLVVTEDNSTYHYIVAQ
jgi:hypothetical protein